MAGTSKRSDNQLRNKRIPTKLPISVGNQSGHLRDISASGVFIVQSAPQAVGSRIEFTIDLDTPSGKMKLACEGEIVRVEELDGRIGVGVKVIRQFGKRLLSEKLRVSDERWEEID